MPSSNRAAAVRFGWQGIAVDVPPDWDLHRFYGDRASGYCGLDDGGRLRLQFRWESAAGRQANVDTALQRYGKSLRQKARRGAGEFLLFPCAPEALNPSSTPSGFHWKGEDERYGVAWHSPLRQRMVLAEVLFPKEGADETGARRILESVGETPPGGWDWWNAYGFAFRAPDSYTLDKADLAAGRLRYLFRAGRYSWLRVERWAAASVWSRTLSLRDWPGELLKLSGITVCGVLERRDAMKHDHGACCFTANISRGWFRSPETVSGVVWACPQEDKMFAVWSAGSDSPALAEGVAVSVVCA